MQLVIGNYNYSSWSLRAWLAALHAGVDFEVERIALDLPDTAERIHRVSAAGRVPVLIDGDLCIWDSLAIAEHLAERVPQAQLWPAEAPARAWARSISAEMHAGFAALRTELPMNLRARGRRVVPSAAAAADLERVISIWTESLVRFDGPWLCGAWSIADAMYAPVAQRMLTYGVELPELVWPWMDAVQADPAMVTWQVRAEAEDEIIDVEEVGDAG